MSNFVYPFVTGSQVTASFATTSSFAISASYIDYAPTASYAIDGVSGSMGYRGTPDVCLITAEQYFQLLYTSSLQEVCVYPDRDANALGGL